MNTYIFDYTTLEIAPLANGSTISNSTQNGNNSSNTTSNSTNDDNSSSTHLPGWAIAVICIAVFAILFGAAASIWAVVLTRRNKKQNKLSPSSGGVAAILGGKKREMSEVGSSNSKAHMIKGLQSTDSVANTNSVENASIAGTLNSRNQPKITSSDAMILADSFRNTLGRPTDWNLSGLGQEEEEELKRRKLGETLLQRQLEEDGTSVKHAGRFTRVKSLNDIPKHATLEHPRNQ